MQLTSWLGPNRDPCNWHLLSWLNIRGREVCSSKHSHTHTHALTERVQSIPKGRCPKTTTTCGMFDRLLSNYICAKVVHEIKHNNEQMISFHRLRYSLLTFLALNPTTHRRIQQPNTQKSSSTRESLLSECCRKLTHSQVALLSKMNPLCFHQSDF